MTAKTLPAYAKEIPVAMASPDRGATCEHCHGAIDVREFYYSGPRGRHQHHLCCPCAKLFGDGTRWEYVGGGTIQAIARTP